MRNDGACASAECRVGREESAERSRGLDLELTLTFAQYSQNYACMMRAQTIFFVIIIWSFMIFTFRLYKFFYFMVVFVVVDLHFIYLFI